MVHARKILVVTIMATLLGSGRVTSAAPAQSGPAVAQMTSRLIARLSGTVRRGLPAGRVYEARRIAPITPARVVPADQTLAIVPLDHSPFHFRLPPPAV